MESMNDQNLDENTEDPNEETEYYMAMPGLPECTLNIGLQGCMVDNYSTAGSKVMFH
jgi:hypothetical protein